EGTRWPAVGQRGRAAGVAQGPGRRWWAVSGAPADILATLAAGWNSSASRKPRWSRAARAAPTVDLPLPLTPIMTMAGGGAAASGLIAGMNGPRRTGGRAHVSTCPPNRGRAVGARAIRGARAVAEGRGWRLPVSENAP